MRVLILSINGTFERVIRQDHRRNSAEKICRVIDEKIP